MNKDGLIGHRLDLDLGQQAPVAMRVIAVENDKVVVEYLNSTAGRIEKFSISDFEKLSGLKLTDDSEDINKMLVTGELEKNEALNDIVDMLCAAPDSQLDKSIIERIQVARHKSKEEFRTEIRHCIDDCVYSALASGFTLKVLHSIYEAFLDGKPDDFRNPELCPWREGR